MKLTLFHPNNPNATRTFESDTGNVQMPYQLDKSPLILMKMENSRLVTRPAFIVFSEASQLSWNEDLKQYVFVGLKPLLFNEWIKHLNWPKADLVELKLIHG